MNGKPNPRRRPQAMDRERAEGLAVEALGFLSGAPERLVRFLETTGMRPDSLRSAAQSPDVLPGVLDYLASDEALLLAFSEEAAVPPDSVMQARHLLSPREFSD